MNNIFNMSNRIMKLFSKNYVNIWKETIQINKLYKVQKVFFTKMKSHKNRIRITLYHVHGVYILEVGFFGMGNNDTCGGHDFLHGAIAKKANKLLGLDLNKEEAKELNEKGFNVVS